MNPADTSVCLAPDGVPAKIPSLSPRSEEHTSELQSPCNIVCRLLLEKKITGFRDRHFTSCGKGKFSCDATCKHVVSEDRALPCPHGRAAGARHRCRPRSPPRSAVRHH